VQQLQKTFQLILSDFRSERKEPIGSSVVSSLSVARKAGPSVSCRKKYLRREISEGVQFLRMDIEWVTKPLESFFFAMIYSNGARPGYLHHFLCAVAKLSEPDKVPETYPMSFFPSEHVRI